MHYKEHIRGFVDVDVNMSEVDERIYREMGGFSKIRERRAWGSGRNDTFCLFMEHSMATMSLFALMILNGNNGTSPFFMVLDGNNVHELATLIPTPSVSVKSPEKAFTVNRACSIPCLFSAVRCSEVVHKCVSRTISCCSCLFWV